MSPQTIKRAKFAELLNKPSLNKQLAKKFIAKYPENYDVEQLQSPDGFELKIKKNKIRLLDRRDTENPRIAYALDIKISAEQIGQKSCTQILVWASPSNEDLLIGLPRKLFNHLLKTYTIMITDQEQTPDGKRFWERRIAQAFTDGLFVYFLDKNNANSVLQPIKNNDDFLENYESKGWGNDELYKNNLFIISSSSIS